MFCYLEASFCSLASYNRNNLSRLHQDVSRSAAWKLRKRVWIEFKQLSLCKDTPGIRGLGRGWRGREGW